ncbi:Alpha-ketoglutarate permease [Monoraphidium neglectum]|uniref:Alpha-ketoglutarate permease n=1 Tax=Monoraphidium neglectum TaxID=145388 RepID=A0A0D2JNP4_9CHLO|nr:Alpha-ketoglutarate permease [Monoraphidium neglectum]KIZ00773.1 Alpha-ketoglutarate permease [Monoraphidium neglectum]|eukprot:XP_013899792.1 Alpha-ketoglutarate permease [Monoraphidium neglectum]
MKSPDPEERLSPQQWGQVITIAGIGTVLEWFDFYTYTQLNATLDRVFFPTDNEAIQALAFWGVYAAGFVVRPIGALIFGHIGDTAGRNRCLVVSILFMAFSTVAIGVLPTYSTGVYRAGIAAPVLLALLRILQGLALGGEHSSAMCYISELADKGQRGRFTAVLQWCVNIGMIIATLMAMMLQNTLSEDAMLNWGWRVPFLCAAATALLGAALRRNMPEPHAFLEAARLQKRLASGGGVAADAAEDGAGGQRCGACQAPQSCGACQVVRPPTAPDLLVQVAAGSEVQSDSLSDAPVEAVHGHAAARTPIVRLMRTNLAGVGLHICHMSWVSAAFYLTCSWLAKDLRTYGYPLKMTQGILIVSLIPNAVGLFLGGLALDRGLPALYSNMALVTAATALAFPVFYGVGRSLAAAWCLVPLFQLFVGAVQVHSLLPCTRIYEPLSRTTGFSFGYNCGYGIIGGLSPLLVAAIKTGLPGHVHPFAPALWLLFLAGVSVLGDVGLRLYQPRLGKPFVGHIE